jgi:glutamyl-tRNA synthetase
MDELIESFTLERVGKSGSRFDPEKAKWFNHYYLQKRSNNQLTLEFRDLLRSKGYHHDIVQLEKLVAMVKERVSFVKEIWDQTDFFFKAPETYDGDAIRKRIKDDTLNKLEELGTYLESSEDILADSFERHVKDWIEEREYKTGDILNALRLVIVGSLRGPHLFDIIAWIGKEETLKRIKRGIAVIGDLKK